MDIYNDFPDILIVEDDLRTAEMLDLALSSRGFHCSIAYDGFDALAKINDSIPDVVLLDICLPGGMNGFEVCSRIKNEFSSYFIPVIVLTAMDDIKSKVYGLDSGADDYITKPYDILEVVARIKSMLRIKNLQNELIVKNKNLEELNQLKDEFLSICSHDLRNIIMPIMEASSLMKDNILPASNLKFADIIHRQSKKMVGLLNSLLKSFASEQGQLVLKPKKLAVQDFVKQYVKDCILLRSVENVEIKYELRVKDKEWVLDPEKIDEVLTNLVANSLKFIHSEGTITIILDKIFTDYGEFIRIGVKDTGEGIPDNKLQNIFNKFVTANTGKNNLGMGLGLSICKAIVEKHGGNIWAENNVDGGCTFYFTIPRIEISDLEEIPCN